MQFEKRKLCEKYLQPGSASQSASHAAGQLAKLRSVNLSVSFFRIGPRDVGLFRQHLTAGLPPGGIGNRLYLLLTPPEVSTVACSPHFFAANESPKCLGAFVLSGAQEQFNTVWPGAGLKYRLPQRTNAPRCFSASEPTS